jgi:hypothetical protein
MRSLRASVGWYATRSVAALSALAVTAVTGCDSPGAETSEPPVAASATESSDRTDHPDRSDHPDRADRPSRWTGARADVPDDVILEQLRAAAERIAQRLPMMTLAPTPVDVDPGTNRALGYEFLIAFGFGSDQWPYLDALWTRESGWDHLAENPRSGAYGIPQSLPGTKMAVVGDDWRTNPDTQIRWGLAYIGARYETPQAAWEHSERVGWY